LVRLARVAADAGFQQIWVNDNIRYRSQIVVLTAIASQVPIRLGTAIMVPYFHNPLDVADSLGALSELCEGREISVGLAGGDLGQSPQHVQPLRPIAMVSETVQLLRQALSGRELKYADYPFLQEFYHLNPSGRFRLAFKPRSSFKFYGGGNGPQALRMCGRIMDGLISSGTYIPMLKAGRLPGVVTNDDYKKCGFRRILVFSAAAHGSHRRQGSLNTRAHGGGPGRARSDFKSAVVRRDRPYVPARTSRDNFRRCAYAMLYRACPTGGCHTIIRE
jgi:hypothetical protein